MAAEEAKRLTVRFEDAVFESVPVDPESVLDGDATWEVATLWRSPDGTKVIGCFRGTPGRFRVKQAYDETTFIRAGRMLVTTEGHDSKVECQAGDVLNLMQGVVYEFEIQETIEEIMVMTSAEGVDF